MADTIGTLLASYWAFVSESPATEEDAKFLVNMLGIEERIAVHQVSDELQCLEALTSRVLPFKVVDGAALVTRHLSIAQAIEMVCKDPTGQPELVMRLAQMGLRVALERQPRQHDRHRYRHPVRHASNRSADTHRHKTERWREVECRRQGNNRMGNHR